jgi:hypothetical protein
MDARNKDFQELCDAVVAGAGNANTHFREAVVPHLRTIMRRSLRRKQGRSAFDANAQDAGRKIVERSRGTHGSDETRVDRTARRLCETLIDALPSVHGPPRNETVVKSFSNGTIVLVPGRG